MTARALQTAAGLSPRTANVPDDMIARGLADPELSGVDLRDPVVAIYDNGTVVGWHAPRQERLGWRVGPIYVEPQHRGKGYGSRTVVDFLSDKDAAPVPISDDNVSSQRSFERAGFRPTDRHVTTDDGWTGRWWERPKTASAYDALSALGSPTAKVVGDVAGLGMLAGTTIDRALVDGDPTRESVRGLGDTLGYASIGVPIAAGLLSKGKAKLDTGDAVALGSIGALALPAIDNLQANVRSAMGPAWMPTSSYQLLPNKAHAALELAGMGALGAQSAKTLVAPGSSRAARAGAATELAGYGTLMTPYAADLASDDGHGQWQGTRRALTDTAGLGLLAAGAIAGHRAH